jgi:hypothetical protein
VQADDPLPVRLSGRRSVPEAEEVDTVGQGRQEPGVAARRLAATAIGSGLDLEPAGLWILRRPPVAINPDCRVEVTVSLSIVPIHP